MRNRFEGETPTFIDMIEAFEAFGLTGLLGKSGMATAYAARYPMGEYVEFNVLPGAYSAKEVSDLRTWAT